MVLLTQEQLNKKSTKSLLALYKAVHRKISFGFDDPDTTMKAARWYLCQMKRILNKRDDAEDIREELSDKKYRKQRKGPTKAERAHRKWEAENLTRT